MATLGDLIKEHSDLIYKLNHAGIKSLQTALDYIQIISLYESLEYIKSKTERKKIVSERLFISKRTVDNALNICSAKIKDA